MKTCPNCKLLSIDEAVRCDCGYNFATGVVVSPDRGQAGASAQGASQSLAKQILGVALASLFFLLLLWPSSLLVVLMGVLVFADAWNAGIRKVPGKSTFLNLSPMAWSICVEGLFIVAFPLYLANRGKLKTSDGNTTLWLFTVALGSLVLLLTAVWIVGLLIKSTGG